MFCPDCGAYTESSFCPNCGRVLTKIPSSGTVRPSASGKQNRKPIYLGNTLLSSHQFAQIQTLVKSGEKQDAIRLICLWTNLSLADAVHITDHFYTIDFSKPQASVEIIDAPIPEISKPPVSSRQDKITNGVKKAGKGIGLGALLGGYGVFRVISGLVKPYLGKQK